MKSNFILLYSRLHPSRYIYFSACFPCLCSRQFVSTRWCFPKYFVFASEMNFLPEEILLDIFQFLSASELLALSTVSKVFNYVINDSKLVQKLQIAFRKLSGDEESIGNRRYSRLKIGFYKPTVHYAILKSIGDELTSLSFVNYKLKLDTIRKILNETPNVRNLKFERVSLSDVPNVMKLPHPQLKIKTLTSVVSDPRLFRVIQNCTVQELNLTQDEHDNYVNFVDLVRLLRLQSCLTSLCLIGFCKTSLFSDNSLDSVDFCLRKFLLADCVFQQTIHLKSFLGAHVESLREINISEVAMCDLSTVLNQMRKLKNLILSNVSMSYLEALPSVEELTICGNKVPEIVLEQTLKVKRLRLKHVRNRRMLSSISENLTDIESLVLVEGSLEQLAVPSIRKLSISSVNDCPTCFFEIHCNIEFLCIENCNFIDDETIRDVANWLGNLKSLTLKCTKKNCREITDKSLEMIRDHCKSIELIRIEGFKNKLNWKLLTEARRDLKIYI